MTHPLTTVPRRTVVFLVGPGAPDGVRLLGLDIPEQHRLARVTSHALEGLALGGLAPGRHRYVLVGHALDAREIEALNHFIAISGVAVMLVECVDHVGDKSTCHAAARLEKQVASLLAGLSGSPGAIAALTERFAALTLCLLDERQPLEYGGPVTGVLLLVGLEPGVPVPLPRAAALVDITGVPVAKLAGLVEPVRGKGPIVARIRGQRPSRTYLDDVGLAFLLDGGEVVWALVSPPTPAGGHDLGSLPTSGRAYFAVSHVAVNTTPPEDA